MPTEVRFIPLINDLMFKYIFSYKANIKYLEYLLENLFNYKSCFLKDKLEVIRGLELEKTKYDDRGLEVDIVVRLPDGKVINLEAYTSFYQASKLKSFLYQGNLFSTQLKSGENFDKVKLHLQINFVKGKNIVSRRFTVLASDDSREKFIDDLFQIDVINIDQKVNNNYTINNKLKKLFKLMGSTTYEEAKENVEGERVLMEMLEDMQKFNWDKWASEYFSRERYQKSVEAEKVQIAKTTEKNDIAKNMLNKSMNIKDISEITGLSEAEILNLKED